MTEVKPNKGRPSRKKKSSAFRFVKMLVIPDSGSETINASSKDLLIELLKDHEAVIILLRKDIDDCAEKNKDAGTADFLTGLMEQHETTAWILRRYFS